MSHQITGANMSNATAQRVYGEDKENIRLLHEKHQALVSENVVIRRALQKICGLTDIREIHLVADIALGQKPAHATHSERKRKAGAYGK